jgi:hypothetical protein
LHGVALARTFLQQPGEQTRNSGATRGIADSATAQNCAECDQRHVVPLHQQDDSAVR